MKTSEELNSAIDLPTVVKEPVVLTSDDSNLLAPVETE
jgi:hypothetical protein